MTFDPPTTHEQRYPTLTESGRHMLDFLREHPHAPIFRNESGNRLTEKDVEVVRAFEKANLNAELGWKPGLAPTWLADFVQECLDHVPHYRKYGSVPEKLQDLPTIDRSDLGRDIARFVPDTVSIEELVNFRTSGTTGHPLLIASHPTVAAKYLTFHKRALRRFGIELRNGRGQVGVVLIGNQKKCFTYVSVTPSMDESGLAKINLDPNDWRDPDDRAKYLDALNPEVITGDPLSFAALAELPVRTQPRALISPSMMLSPEFGKALEARFNCPVLDVYSLNEAGPIAVADSRAGGHVLLQPQMFVEILDSDDRPVPMGKRGEVTLTGGFNFCLPLLRYRTGDYACLDMFGDEVVLRGLAGREPVRFRTMKSEWINNIEVTLALRELPHARCPLPQGIGGTLRM